MRVLCLGGAGRIGREAVWDLVQTSALDQITIADVNVEAGQGVVAWLDDPRVDFVPVDVNDFDETVQLMRHYAIVMDATPIAVNSRSTACIAGAGAHGINLNGVNNEWDFDEIFQSYGKTCVPGFGMTPGISNLLVKRAADLMDTVDTIRISHVAFRPLAMSPGIVESSIWEYLPDHPSRVVYEEGRFVRVPPFARPMEVRFPEPFGVQRQYLVPHPEPFTLAQSLKSKGVRRIEIRGTWSPKSMELFQALYDWGFLRNESISLGGTTVPIMDAITQHLIRAPEGKTCDIYGCALHVEVSGMRDGQPVCHVLTCTHPLSDGSEPDWEGLRAYTRCIGIPLSIGVQLIAAGKVQRTGTVFPELAFDPQEVFNELAKRGIHVHEVVQT